MNPAVKTLRTHLQKVYASQVISGLAPIVEAFGVGR